MDESWSLKTDGLTYNFGFLVTLSLFTLIKHSKSTPKISDFFKLKFLKKLFEKII